MQDAKLACTCLMIDLKLIERSVGRKDNLKTDARRHASIIRQCAQDSGDSDIIIAAEEAEIAISLI